MIYDVLSIDFKCGLGLNVSFISEIGVDLFSQKASISLNNYKETVTSGVSFGAIGYEVEAPDHVYKSGLEALTTQGKGSISLGPTNLNNDEVVS